MATIRWVFCAITLTILCYSVKATLCPSDLSQLPNLLCHVVKVMFPKFVPGSGPAIYFVDKLFTTGDTNVWDGIKTDVEKYVGEKFDGYKTKQLNIWHQSMVSRLHTCTSKVDVRFKRSCLQNLQEDLSGYEPKFRGQTDRENALYLKYYDIYVVTFLSVSNMLKSISNTTRQASIDRDVAIKARIFEKHLKTAVPSAKQYTCRVIKIEVRREFLIAFWKHQMYWPKYPTNMYIPNIPEFSAYHKGCGVLKKAVYFQSRIYNTKTDKVLKGGPWTYLACTQNEGVSRAILMAQPAWDVYNKACVRTVSSNLWDQVTERIKQLQNLF